MKTKIVSMVKKINQSRKNEEDSMNGKIDVLILNVSNTSIISINRLILYRQVDSFCQ